MSDPAAFLRARLDEDEVAARACQSPSPWKAATHEFDTWIVTDATGEPVIHDEGTPSLEEAAHIARHDPARVLREVEAKRAILAEYEKAAREADRLIAAGAGESEDEVSWRLALEMTCAQLAAVYHDHPDYGPGWKP